MSSRPFLAAECGPPGAMRGLPSTTFRQNPATGNSLVPDLPAAPVPPAPKMILPVTLIIGR